MAKSHLCLTGGNNKIICVCVCVCMCKTKRGKKKKRSEQKEEEESDKKQIALVDPGSKRRGGGRGVEGEGGWGETPPSDRQRDKAVVLLDVTFENV